MATKHAALHALIEPVVAAMGFELWGIDHVSQGKHSRLVVYIESESGVSVKIALMFSRQVSAVMDVEDPIPGETGWKSLRPVWHALYIPWINLPAIKATMSHLSCAWRLMDGANTRGSWQVSRVMKYCYNWMARNLLSD